MANTLTTNPAVFSRFTAIAAMTANGLANITTYAGDTQDSGSPPTLDTDGTPFFGFQFATCPFKVTNPGGGNTVIMYVYGMYRFADGSIAWNEVGTPSASVTNVATFTMSGAERIAARMEIDGGSPHFAIDFNGYG